MKNISRSIKVKILIGFLVAVIVLTPMAVIDPQVTAITDAVYVDEEGKLSEGEAQNEDDYSGLGYGNAFDMFGEMSVTKEEESTEPVVTTTQSSTKAYQVAVKKGEKTPTQPGSEVEIVTTTKKLPETDKLSYEKVGNNMDVKGTKLRTIGTPSEKSQIKQLSSGYLLAIKNPDQNYKYDGLSVEMTPEDLNIAERLVMGEAGSMGFYGCCLVAQSIRDTYYYGHFKSVEAVRKAYKYDGKLTFTPNSAAKKAVQYILKEGHSAVQHRILYFYNPKLCVSKFHESQNYILTYKDVRFFD